MKELNATQIQAVSGGFWGYIVAIAVSFVAETLRHRQDKDAVNREGMDPNRRETAGF